MGKRIKVVYLISSLKKCGPVNVVYSIVKNIDLDKFEPIIVTLKRENNDSRLKDFINCGVKVYLKSNLISCIMTLKSLSKKKETIILHSHGIVPDLVNLFFKYSNYINVSTIHSNLIEDYALSFGKCKGKILVLIHCSILKKLICVSCGKAVQAKMLEKEGVASIAIPNGVSFDDKMIEKTKTNNSRNKCINIVYIGTVTSRKNVEFLIQAILHFTDKRVALNIVGNGNELALLKSRYNKTKNIVFSGFKKDPTSEFQEADIIASASNSEGLPLAILEGLSFGKPVFLSQIDSHMEILKKRVFGESFKVNDFESFNANLEKLITNMSDSMTIYKEAKAMFSDKLMTKKYEKLYNRLIQIAI